MSLHLRYQPLFSRSQRGIVRLVCEAFGQGPPGANPELGEDVAEVKLDSLDADVQLCRGFPVGAASRDQPCDGQFARSKAERALAKSSPFADDLAGTGPELNAASGKFLVTYRHVRARGQPGQQSACRAEPGDGFRPPRRLAKPSALG